MSDHLRSEIIHIASELPKGDKTRVALLKAAYDDDTPYDYLVEAGKHLDAAAAAAEKAASRFDDEAMNMMLSRRDTEQVTGPLRDVVKGVRDLKRGLDAADRFMSRL